MTRSAAPTGADLLADVTAHAVRATVSRPELDGTYHVAAKGETTLVRIRAFGGRTCASAWMVTASFATTGCRPFQRAPIRSPPVGLSIRALVARNSNGPFLCACRTGRIGIRRLLEEIAPA